MRPPAAALALVFATAPAAARADIIPPAVEVCDGKRVADPCSSEEGLGLDAFGGEPARRFDGHCAPIEHHRTGAQMLICRPGAAPPALVAAAAASAPSPAPRATGEAAPATSQAPSASPPPSLPSAAPPPEPASRGCACRFVPARDLSGAGVAFAFTALAFARRRRR